MKKDRNNSILRGVGFNLTSGSPITKAITRKHTIEDNGKTFTDNFGRTYKYMFGVGYIYDTITNIANF